MSRWALRGALAIGLLAISAVCFGIAYWFTRPGPAQFLLDVTEVDLGFDAERPNLPFDSPGQIVEVGVESQTGQYRSSWLATAGTSLSWFELQPSAVDCTLQTLWNQSGSSFEVRIRWLLPWPSAEGCASRLSLEQAGATVGVAAGDWVRIRFREKALAALLAKRVPTNGISFVPSREVELQRGDGPICKGLSQDRVSLFGDELNLASLVVTEKGMTLRLDTAGAWTARVGLCTVDDTKRNKDLLQVMWGCVIAFLGLVVTLRQIDEWCRPGTEGKRCRECRCCKQQKCGSVVEQGAKQ